MKLIPQVLCQRVAFLYRERERESIIYIFLNPIIESKNRHSDIHTCLSALYPCRYHVAFGVFVSIYQINAVVFLWID